MFGPCSWFYHQFIVIQYSGKSDPPWYQVNSSLVWRLVLLSCILPVIQTWWFVRLTECMASTHVQNVQGACKWTVGRWHCGHWMDIMATRTCGLQQCIHVNHPEGCGDPIALTAAAYNPREDWKMPWLHHKFTAYPWSPEGPSPDHTPTYMVH